MTWISECKTINGEAYYRFVREDGHYFSTGDFIRIKPETAERMLKRMNGEVPDEP